MPKTKQLFNILMVFLPVLIGIAVTYLAKDFIQDVNEARSIIATSFSTLSGFLILSMSMTGERFSKINSLQESVEKKKYFEAKLTRQKYLFYLYITILIILSADSLLIKDSFPNLSKYIAFIYIALGIVAFIFSLKLPSLFMRIQADIIEETIKENISKSSILDRNS